MFEIINISLDLKDLEMIKNSLLNEIENLETQNFSKENNQDIDEHKQLLRKIHSNLKKLQNF